MEVQSTHDPPIHQGEVAGRPKQELRAPGRKRAELIPSHTGSAAGATHSVKERGQEQLALMRYPEVPQVVRGGVQRKTGWGKGC